MNKGNEERDREKKKINKASRSWTFRYGLQFLKAHTKLCIFERFYKINAVIIWLHGCNTMSICSLKILAVLIHFFSSCACARFWYFSYSDVFYRIFVCNPCMYVSVPPLYYILTMAVNVTVCYWQYRNIKKNST